MKNPSSDNNLDFILHGLQHVNCKYRLFECKKYLGCKNLCVKNPVLKGRPWEISALNFFFFILTPYFCGSKKNTDGKS